MLGNEKIYTSTENAIKHDVCSKLHWFSLAAMAVRFPPDRRGGPVRGYVATVQEEGHLHTSVPGILRRQSSSHRRRYDGRCQKLMNSFNKTEAASARHYNSLGLSILSVYDVVQCRTL